MSVKVVKVNQQRRNYTYYIGRLWAGLPESIFHNPFHIGKDGIREEVLAKFAAYWYAPEQWALRQAAWGVLDEDEILGCWCKPLACHGDIIAGYLNWKRQERTLW